jgi:hypothetical protein
MKGVALILVLASTICGYAERPDHIWSKQGSTLYLVLDNEDITKVGNLSVSSPDEQSRLEVSFKPGPQGDAIPIARLVLGHRVIPVQLDASWAQIEVLWSPDSRSLAITGSYNAYTNSTRIFLIRANSIQQTSTVLVRTDMVRTFPPCKASNADPTDCRREESGEDFNYATVAWASPTTAVVMAEVPCSSSQGGIMCQVRGYELDTQTGKILRRMNATQLKTTWQSKLAWKLRVPSPPEWAASAH